MSDSVPNHTDAANDDADDAASSGGHGTHGSPEGTSSEPGASSSASSHWASGHTPTSPTARRSTPPPEKSHDQTIKETIESVLIAFIFAFVFRAYVVEAFVIPTGSMAPTLLGQHVRVRCEQCGYRFSLDASGKRKLETPRRALCPMCRFPNLLERGTPSRAGDRILVHKYIYRLTKPERWDVVVFKNPQHYNHNGSVGPDTNYIKRLVGLPGEQIAMLDGNVYVRDLPNDHAQGAAPPTWHIARKTDASTNDDWQAIQREVWEPIYHSQYVPMDGGRDSRRRGGQTWEVPWEPTRASARPEAWDIEPHKPSRSYHYDASAPGELRFHFTPSDQPLGGFAGGASLFPYNQLKMREATTPIEDIRLALTVEPEQRGLELGLSTTARLDKLGGPPQRLTAQITPKGEVRFIVTDPRSGARRVLSKTARIDPLSPSHATNVELWFVDQEASVWIDGERVLRWRIKLDHVTDIHAFAAKRSAPRQLPDPRIEVAGSPVTLHRVELDRDLYYTSQRGTGARTMPLGGLVRRGSTIRGGPATIHKGEFFCAGDNGPLSHDGRYWDTVEPWVEKWMFPPRKNPNNELEHAGLVPRDLMIGRAFFVYYPAPYPVAKGSSGIIPNFGDMRFIH